MAGLIWTPTGCTKRSRRSARAPISRHFKTLELLGECHALLGEADRAVVSLAAATTLNRQSRAPSLRAEVFERLGDFLRAAEMARLALDREVNNKRAQAVFARLGASNSDSR